MATIGATSGQYPAFRFRVSFTGVNGSFGFNSVSGLSQETEEILYRHGEEATTQHKLRGLTSFGDVTLQQGLFSGSEDTLREAFAVFQKNEENQEKYVNTVSIEQLDMQGNPVLKWELSDAWISSFELEDYDANSSAIQFLSVTLKHEGIVFSKL